MIEGLIVLTAAPDCFAQLERVKFLLNKRDDIITLLARRDPAAANRLSDMYVAYRRAMNDVGSAETASIWAGSE